METRVRNIPEDIWLRFKVLCINERTPMNDKVVELVKKYVDQADKQAKRAG